MNQRLNILTLPETFDDKINAIAAKRLKLLHQELDEQQITDYTIIEGFYDKKNTKQAIHKGHNKIIQLAKEQGMTNCIVAEDDIKFSHPNSYKYFLSQIPESYDIFSGLIYAGTVKDNRVMNGASGILSLYSVHSRFYDYFLSLNVNSHLDRELGSTAFKHEYYVCDPYVCIQRGGFSINLNRIMFYDAYLVDKTLYNG